MNCTKSFRTPWALGKVTWVSAATISAPILIIVFIVKLCNWKNTKLFISYQRTSLFLFNSTILLIIFVWHFLNNWLLTHIFTWFIIVSTFISSCGIIMENFIFRLFFLAVLLWNFLLLFFFFLWLYFFTFDKLFKGLSLKSILCFFKILFVLEMIITNKLFFLILLRLYLYPYILCEVL